MNVNIIKNRTFQEKLLWFRLNIEALRIAWHNGAHYAKIDRANIIRSSLTALRDANLRK